MPSFSYEALAPDGSVRTGTIFGPSIPEVVGQFSSRGWTITRIEQAADFQPAAPTPAATPAPTTAAAPVQPLGRYDLQSNTEGYAIPSVGEDYQPVQRGPMPGGPTEEELINLYRRNFFATNIWGPTLGKVPLPTMQFFFQQFGTMLNAGVPMVQALDTLSSNSRDIKFRKILLELKDAATIGHPLSGPMQRYPEVFTPLIVSMVRAGEEGGFLDRSLRQIADYLTEEIQLRNLYKKTTAYPKLVLAASIVIVGLANTIISIIGRGNQIAAPLNSLFTWMWLAPLIIGLFLFFRIGLSIPTIRYQWDRMVRWIPFVGPTLTGFAMAKFGRAMGALHAAGVATPKAIGLSADACGNEYVRSQLYPARTKLERGEGIANTLRATGALSPIVLDMISTGETTGSLDSMLNKVAEFYEDDSKTKAVQMGHFVGVVTLGIAAAYVAYVIFSFFSSYSRAVSDVAGEADRLGRGE